MLNNPRVSLGPNIYIYVCVFIYIHIYIYLYIYIYFFIYLYIYIYIWVFVTVCKLENHVFCRYKFTGLGKSSINGPFSIALLRKNQRAYVFGRKSLENHGRLRL